MLTGGGISNRSGGVGTMMAALRNEWGTAVSTRVIDTRGRGGAARGALFFVWVLLQFVTAGRVDLVHLHMTTRGSMVRKCVLLVLCSVMRRPAIVHMHGADFETFFTGMRPVWRRLLSAVLHRAAHVVVLGEGWRRFLVERVGVDGARVSVVRNGAGLPRARVEGRSGVTHVLFLGRLGDRKGVPELMAALGSAPLLQRAWRATLAGDGDLARFAVLAERCGIAGRVVMPGWVDREAAAALLGGADVLVLPSFDEALPMAVVEALAHGVAVVATPVGVVGELLHDGVDALLVAPGDVAALSRALVRLIDDAGLRGRLAAAGHDVFRTELDVAVTASQMLRLYAEAAWPGGREAGQEAGDPGWAR